jgi:hypothetical protein
MMPTMYQNKTVHPKTIILNQKYFDIIVGFKGSRILKLSLA